MKKAKKNNKGFSLVELIVVVLIMAIIAVALAPQVMKWVDKSRISTDRQTADSVVSFAQLALTDKAANKAVSDSSKGYTITIGTDCTIAVTGGSNAGTGDDFLKAFCANAGVTVANPITSIKMKSGKTVTISVSKDGVVTSSAATDLADSELD